MDNLKGQGRKFGSTIVTIISVVIFLFSLLYIGNVPGFFGIHVSIVPYCGVLLALMLVLVFTIHPLKKGMSRGRLPWYDILLIVMSLCGAGYIALFMGRWQEFLIIGSTTVVEVVLGLMLIIAVLEGTRRTIGITMSMVALVFILHLLFGHYFPGVLGAPKVSLERAATIFYLAPSGIFGVPVVVSFTVVIVFMFFSAFIQKSDAGKFVIDSAFSLTGRWTGGPAKSAVLASSALGTMVGATAANVATTGTITIPLMKSTGYTPEFAGAVESAASNGGQIMPPVMGLVSFLIAELLGVPYWSVCVAAFLPAILYYTALFIQVHFEAVKLKLYGLPREQLPSFRRVLKGGWFYLLPLFLLVYLLAVAHLPVQHCGLYAFLAVIPITIIDWTRKTKTRKGVKEIVAWLVDCIETGVKSLVMPSMACATAGIIIGAIGSSGFGFRLSSMVLDLAGGNLFLLLLITAIASFILGMGMTSVPCYLILAILIAPALVSMGVLPLAAHLFVFYFGIVSFITPPVAVAAFVAAGIAGGNPVKTGFTAVRLGIGSFIVPFIFVYNPALLLTGSIGGIILTAVSTLIGVIFLGGVLEGFLLKKLAWLERLMFLLGALLLITPGWVSSVAGAVIVGLTLLWHIKAAGISGGDLATLQ